MQVLFNELSDSVRNEYTQLYDIEANGKNIFENFKLLMIKYDVINTLLRKTQYQYNLDELRLEQLRIDIKTQAIIDGMKSTEAREYSKTMTQDGQKELFVVEKDVKLLRDIRRSIEIQMDYIIKQEVLE